MAKHKWQNAWTATLDVRVPISAEDPSTAAEAKAAVEAIAATLPAGAHVSITRAGFGKMEIPLGKAKA